MELRSQAKAVANLDAICDEFEQALRSGDASGDDDPVDLDSWLQRVDPEMRSWLRQELEAIQQELGSPPHLQGPNTQSIPEGIDPQSWQTVIECETFQQLSRELKVSLAASIEARQYQAGDALLRSGNRAVGLFLIAEGTVQVIAGEGADRHEIDTDGAGSVLGEMSMLTGYPCSADVVATSPVQALVLPVEKFDSLRNAWPEVEIALSQLVSDRLGHRRKDALCGKSLGGYRLQHCISSGAMGVVYSAEDEETGSSRALKMLRHRFIYSPRVVSRFDQEVELLRQLQHPNIVALRGHFVAYRTRFIVLDLYDGADLRQVLRRHGRIAEATARGALGQIAAGLAQAHRQGVLHLDLKPANVLIDQTGHIAITDFGLSRLIESDGCDQDCVGTPAYMPPEQFMMANVGPHCDWYSFGCVAYELLSGKRLFQAEESSQFLDDKLRSPSSSWPAVDASGELCANLQSALHPMVADRSLDLEKIAAWARPVPELAVSHEDF